MVLGGSGDGSDGRASTPKIVPTCVEVYDLNVYFRCSAVFLAHI